MSLHSSANSFQSTTPTYLTTSHIPWNKRARFLKKMKRHTSKPCFFCLFSCLNIHINDTDRVCVCTCLFYLIVYVKGHVPLLSSLPLRSIFIPFIEAVFVSLWAGGLQVLSDSSTMVQALAHSICCP